MALFGMQWPLLQVERTFDQVTQWNWEDVKNASLAVSQADLQSIGGAAALFPAIKSGLNNRLFTELRRLLSDAEFTSAMSYGVKPFSFTTEQVNHIMDLVQMGYAQVSQNAIEDEIILTKLISVFGRYFDLPVNVDGIDRGLITTYLTAKDGQAFNGSVWVSRGWFGSQLVRVVLPKYSYDFSERLSAAKFLNGPQPALIDRLNRDIMQALQLTNVEDIDTLDLGALPTVVAEWVSNNKTIISQLSRPVRPDGNWWDGF